MSFYEHHKIESLVSGVVLLAIVIIIAVYLFPMGAKVSAPSNSSPVMTGEIVSEVNTNSGVSSPRIYTKDFIIDKTGEDTRFALTIDAEGGFLYKVFLNNTLLIDDQAAGSTAGISPIKSNSFVTGINTLRVVIEPNPKTNIFDKEEECSFGIASATGKNAVSSSIKDNTDILVDITCQDLYQNDDIMLTENDYEKVFKEKIKPQDVVDKEDIPNYYVSGNMMIGIDDFWGLQFYMIGIPGLDPNDIIIKIQDLVLTDPQGKSLKNTEQTDSIMTVGFSYINDYDYEYRIKLPDTQLSASGTVVISLPLKGLKPYIKTFPFNIRNY